MNDPVPIGAPVDSRLRSLLAGLLAVVLTVPADAAEQKLVSARPGTPNIWSMEQAHYLLSRLRANKDGLQLKRPSDDDLDPNAINGIRLDALQSFFNAGVGFDQIGGTENRLKLDEYTAANSRRRNLVALADARLQDVQAREIERITLEEELAVLNARAAEATEPDEKKSIAAQITAKTARMNATAATVTALRAQVTELVNAANSAGQPAAPASGEAADSGAKAGNAAGASPSVPALTTPSDPSAVMTRKELLDKTFTTLLNQTAASFRQPRLHASQFLDNFVQMQYEIVAKQLTTLRDEVGKGQRVVFLELPTSLDAAAHRRLPFVAGGEDRLAQSWWRLKTLYLSYDKGSSPCWLSGEDVLDGLQTEIGFRGGPDVDDVPRYLKGRQRTDHVKSASEQMLEAEMELIRASIRQLTGKRAASSQSEVRDARRKVRKLEEELSRLEELRSREYGAPVPEQTREAEQMAARDSTKMIREKLDELDRQVKLLVNRETAALDLWRKYDTSRRREDAARGAIESANLSLAEADRMVQEIRPDEKDRIRTANLRKRARADYLSQEIQSYETAHFQSSGLEKEWKESQEQVTKVMRNVRRLQAEIIGSNVSLGGQLPYQSAGARARIAELEADCRTLQVDTSVKGEALRNRQQLLQSQLARFALLDETIAANDAAIRITAEELSNKNAGLEFWNDRIAHLEADLAGKQSDLAALVKRHKPESAEVRRARRQVESTQAELGSALQNRAGVKRESDTIAEKLTWQRAEQFRLGERDKQRQQYRTELEQLKKEEEIVSRTLQDALEFHQTRIYAEFGGPYGIQHAFRMDLNEDGTPVAPADRGMVRAIEILPRQTALNVNTTHQLVQGAKLTGAFKYLFGLGGQVDYERMRETYDQFVQQEVFASGFGKGSTVFGWTFGPNPGTRVLNPGTRTTYAALTVPATATGVVVEARGCSFHHNDLAPSADEDKPCSDWSSFSLGLPDRATSGSFQIRAVGFSPARPGDRTTITLHGRFSPETTVLVNGRRLVQVVGLGKPIVPMDFGPSEEQEGKAISGSFEFVNEHNLAINLNIPADYKVSKFPRLTLISPSRSSTINQSLILVNGVLKRLEDEELLVESKPQFALTGIELLDSRGSHYYPGRVTARLSGERLSLMQRLWINGYVIDPEYVTRVSDNHALIMFEPPVDSLRWNISAATGDVLEKRTSSSITIANPLRLYISGVAVKPGSVRYNETTGAAEEAEVQISGNAFHPALTLRVLSGGVADANGFASPEQWNAKVLKISGELTLQLAPPGVPVGVAPIGSSVTARIRIPPQEKEKDKPEEKPKPKSTVTEVSIQRTVSEK